MNSLQEENIQAEFMNGLCHTLAKAAVARMPWMALAISSGQEPDGMVVPDHAFALDPVSGRACDVRGWFTSVHDLLAEGGLPVDGRGEPMQWISGESARQMISEALDSGYLRHPNIEEATRATEAASILCRTRPL